MRPSRIIETETVIGALSGVLGTVHMASSFATGPLGWITYFLLFGSMGLMAANWVLQLFRPSKEKVSHNNTDIEY